MRKIKAHISMLQSLLVDWFHSPRTLISAFFLIALAYMNARSFSYMLETSFLYAYAGETVYYYISNGFGNMTMTSALFLIMMAEIPRRIAFQNVLLVRSSRKSWLASQVMFCCLISVAMICFMLVLSLLFSAASISGGTGWSDLERMAADPDAEWLPQLTNAFIRQITPIQASGLAALILFFFWFTMTLVILLCSLFEKPNAGVMVYVSLLVLHVTIVWEALPSWMRYMPINFSTLISTAANFPEHEFQGIPYVLGVYVLIDLLLILIMAVKVKRMELFFSERR